MQRRWCHFRRLPHTISPLEGDGFEPSVPRPRRALLSGPLPLVAAKGRRRRSRHCGSARFFLLGKPFAHGPGRLSANPRRGAWFTATLADHRGAAKGRLASKALGRTVHLEHSAPKLDMHGCPFMNSPRSSADTRLILIGAAVLLSLGMGIRQSFGLFLTPVTRDLALTAADFTLAVAVQNIVWGLSQAPIGAVADRFGLRTTMMAGAAIYVIGLGVMAAAGSATALIVSGGLIGVALSCTASSLGLTAVARAVPEGRRSKVLGVVAAI